MLWPQGSVSSISGGSGTTSPTQIRVGGKHSEIIASHEPQTRASTKAQRLSVGVEVERKLTRRDERAGLPEDRAACARIKLGMVWHVQRLFCAVSQDAAQLHMAAALRRDRESKPLKDPDDIGSRQSPKVRQPRVPIQSSR